MLESILVGLGTGIVSSLIVTLVFKWKIDTKDKEVKKIVMYSPIFNLIHQSRWLQSTDNMIFHEACDPETLRFFVDRHAKKGSESCNEILKHYSNILTKKEFKALSLVAQSSNNVIHLVEEKRLQDLMNMKEDLLVYYRNIYAERYNHAKKTINNELNVSLKALANAQVLLEYLQSIYELGVTFNYMIDKVSLENFSNDLKKSKTLYDKLSEDYKLLRLNEKNAVEEL